MVLSRTFLLALLAAAGCGESLFDAHGKRDGGTPGGDGGPDGPPVPKTCPDECLGDAAKDFSDSTTDAWRYVDDTRSRDWIPMLVVGDMATGTPGNGIKRCSAERSAPGCTEMPDALLISSGGSALVRDPALEFTYMPSPARAVRLALRAKVSADHTVHLYRNSREDLLYRELATPGPGVEHSVLVDALPGDRFLIALEPMRATGGTVALDFFIYDSDADPPFPSSCQLAASFSEAPNNIVKDLCTSRDLTSKEAGGSTAPPTLETTDPPFSQQGSFVRIPFGSYLQAADEPKLVRNGKPLTVQFWARVTTLPPAGMYASAFSDLDIDQGGGANLSLYGTISTLQVSADKTPGPATNLDFRETPFSEDRWHFVRMVDGPDAITVCIDGAPAMSLPVTSDRGEATHAVYLGKVTDAQNDPPLFEGDLDDVRVFSGALPCDPP